MYGGDQPDIMASLMYGNMANMANLANMGYQQPRYAPTMMGMMPDMGIGMQVGAQPNYMMSKKPSKDKNAPKRNWTSYQFYVEEVFHTLTSTTFSRILTVSLILEPCIPKRKIP